MDELDRIPWKQLKHAYGTAADVPGLLRALRTAPRDRSDDDAPLWSVFTSICHQGTVYEASCYAVPYLLKLAADRTVPDRAGVLFLLAEIAKGMSGQKKWVVRAHRAVAKGFDLFVEIARQGGEFGLAAAHVLAQFPDSAAKVGRIVRRLLAVEKRPPPSAGLILLLGEVGDASPAARSALAEAAGSDELSVRQAAAVSIARLKLRPLPRSARDAIVEALTVEESEDFRHLPWDASGDTDNYFDELRACLAAGPKGAGRDVDFGVRVRSSE